jgi:hypothetical protein
MVVALFGPGLATLALVACGDPRAHSQESFNPFGRPQPIAGGKFEASGVVHVPGTSGFLFVDDSRTREVFWLDLTSEGVQKGAPVPIPLGLEIVDPEGITSDGKYIYVVGSQSKPRGLPGVGLMRFVYSPARRQIHGVESIRELASFLTAALPELRGVELNIEGLAWDQGRNRLLLGLRAPLRNGQALVVPLALLKPDGPLTTANLRIERPIALQLNGGGIRSIEYDTARGAFLVISGSSSDNEERDFRVLLWPGTPTTGSLPTVLARFADNLKPEGIAKATLQGSEATMIVFDASRFALAWK